MDLVRHSYERQRRMNITEATLFLGLDGFARSLNYYAVGMELAL